jgi:hypothetical protein
METAAWLIDMAPREELFHTAAGTAFADITVDGHRQTWPIRSKRFRGWLRRRYYQATGGAASAAEIRSALDLLEAMRRAEKTLSKRNSTDRSVPSTSASLSMPATSISISLTRSGAPSTSDPMDA